MRSSLRVVHAHCDIPCGIYDPHGAQLAALTAVRMNQLMTELPKPGPQTTPEERDVYVHKLSRYSKVKDEQAELCKQELRILWGDYFTPEHLQKFPELHGLFWDAMKLASKVRQELNLQAAQDLLAKVQKIAEIFWKSKGADVRRQPSLQKAGGELLYPVAQAK
ncbi:MAG: superoxide dismutase, Ni [Candidatus Omnitrophica bacterium]|nr:superoxide dismutase, Ni [Candidatus Omnitrophota bacterium]